MSDLNADRAAKRWSVKLIVIEALVAAILSVPANWLAAGKIPYFPVVRSSTYDSLSDENSKLKKENEKLQANSDPTTSDEYTSLKKKYDDLKTEYNALKEDYDELTTSKAAEVKGKTYLTDVQVTAKDSGIAVGETVKDTYGKEYKRAITFPENNSIGGISVTLLTAQKYDHLRFWVVPTKDMEKGQSTTIRVYDNTSEGVIKETDEIVQETHGDKQYYDLTITDADSITLNASSSDGNVAVYGYFYND